jgi:hypothetical protein
VYDGIEQLEKHEGPKHFGAVEGSKFRLSGKSGNQFKFFWNLAEQCRTVIKRDKIKPPLEWQAILGHFDSRRCGAGG